MNIYKNLLFLHGHFVDPRDADDESPVAGRQPAAFVPASRPAQAARRAGPRSWWLRLWPAQSARVDACDGAHGCA